MSAVRIRWGWVIPVLTVLVVGIAAGHNILDSGLLNRLGINPTESVNRDSQELFTDSIGNSPLNHFPIQTNNISDETIQSLSIASRSSTQGLNMEQTPIPGPPPLPKWDLAQSPLTDEEFATSSLTEDSGIILDIYSVSVRGDLLVLFFGTKTQEETVEGADSPGTILPAKMALAGENNILSSEKISLVYRSGAVTLGSASFQLQDSQSPILILEVDQMISENLVGNQEEVAGKWRIPLLRDNYVGVVTTREAQMFSMKPSGRADYPGGVRVEIAAPSGVAPYLMARQDLSQDVLEFITFTVTEQGKTDTAYVTVMKDGSVDVTSRDEYSTLVDLNLQEPTPVPSGPHTGPDIPEEFVPDIIPDPGPSQDRSLWEIIEAEFKDEYEAEVARLKAQEASGNVEGTENPLHSAEQQGYNLHLPLIIR